MAFIIALPEPFCNMDKQKVLKDFTELFRRTYGVNCIAAMHHNKTKTNLHIHLIFSEREELKNGIKKIATRNMFYDETGKHVRTKKEILDDSGNVRKGCNIIRKGEVYEYNRFSKKKAEFKARSFLKGVKTLYTEHINSFLNDKDKLQVFNNKDVYLPTKKIGKNNPKAEQIRKNNQVRMKWNSTVDEALFYQVPRKHIRTIKEEKILKNVNKFGKTETKTVGGLRKNKSSRESAGVGIFAGVFEKVVEMSCDCLKGLIRIYRGAIAPKPPQPVKEYKQYAKMVDELLDNHRALNRVHMAMRETKDKMDLKEYRMFGGKKKLKDDIVQLEKQEKTARSLENPKSFLLGAAAQFGIYSAYFLAILMGFNGMAAASISIIGGADGPTSIFLAGKLGQTELLGPIAVAAYSYMSLVPIIQPPIMRLFTTEKERKIKMEQLRPVSQLEKILFPIIVTIVVVMILPTTAPLVGMLMLGNLFRESGVVKQLQETASNALMYIVVILLGTSVGATTSAEAFLNVDTLKIVVLGLVAFAVGTAAGVLFGKLLCVATHGKVNPLIGSAGVSAVPMAARVSQKVGAEADPTNFLLMHAMGPNVAGVIGTAVAAGTFMAIFGV